MDEMPKQLLKDARNPLPLKPGLVERMDGEYAREGVVNVFLFCEPLTGQRWVDLTAQQGTPQRNWATLKWVHESCLIDWLATHPIKA